MVFLRLFSKKKFKIFLLFSTPNSLPKLSPPNEPAKISRPQLTDFHTCHTACEDFGANPSWILVRTPRGPASEFWYEFLVNFFSTAFAQRNEPRDLSPLFHLPFRTAFSGIVEQKSANFRKKFTRNSENSESDIPSNLGVTRGGHPWAICNFFKKSVFAFFFRKIVGELRWMVMQSGLSRVRSRDQLKNLLQGSPWRNWNSHFENK